MIALGITIAIMLLSRRVERSRFGMALISIKQNEAAAEAAGIDTLAWKLRAITLSGAIAGAVGAFYAVVLLVVTPDSVFGMLVSAQALTVTMFGGIGSIWGPVIGAAILIPTGELLQAKLGARFPGIEGVIYGFAIIVVILAAPEGIYWKVKDLWRRRTTAPDAVAAAASAAHDPGPAPAVSQSPGITPREPGKVILTVRNLSKSFGGLKAVQDVSFDVGAGIDPRHHRAERRGQDHVVQSAQWLPEARCRRGSARRQERHRTQAASALRMPASAAPSRSCGRFQGCRSPIMS